MRRSITRHLARGFRRNPWRLSQRLSQQFQIEEMSRARPISVAAACGTQQQACDPVCTDRASMSRKRRGTQEGPRVNIEQVAERVRRGELRQNVLPEPDCLTSANALFGIIRLQGSKRKSRRFTSGACGTGRLHRTEPPLSHARDPGCIAGVAATRTGTRSVITCGKIRMCRYDRLSARFSGTGERGRGYGGWAGSR